jgi:hypothetical protein
MVGQGRAGQGRVGASRSYDDMPGISNLNVHELLHVRIDTSLLIFTRLHTTQLAVTFFHRA